MCGNRRQQHERDASVSLGSNAAANAWRLITATAPVALQDLGWSVDIDPAARVRRRATGFDCIAQADAMRGRSAA